MKNNKKVLAFIGARSGSKGLKDKNIKLFAGKPMIAWTIEAALNSAFIDRVVVSTDSQHYADIAQEFGAQVIMRPAALSGDQASLIAGLQHAYDIVKADEEFDSIVNLQPTSPLRTAEHIDQAISLYYSEQEKYKNENIRVFSCFQVANKFAWIMRQDQQGFAQFIDRREQQKTDHARQANPQILLPNGAIFILPSNDLTQFYNGKTVAYIMPEEFSIDIDVQADFDLALKLKSCQDYVDFT